MRTLNFFLIAGLLAAPLSLLIVVSPVGAQGYGHPSQTSHNSASVNPIPGTGSMVGGTQPGGTSGVQSVNTQTVPVIPVQQSTSVQTTTVQQQTPGATTTTTTTTVTNQNPQLRPAQPQTETTSVVKYKEKHVRNDWRAAKRMARYHWLDKSVQADPSLVEAICRHYCAAKELAGHPRLGEIAQYDHYTCRRLTKYRTCARILASSGECAKVIALDPEGIYRAIKRDRRVAKLLATNPMFNEMIEENPDLGVLIAKYM